MGPKKDLAPGTPNPHMKDSKARPAKQMEVGAIRGKNSRQSRDSGAAQPQKSIYLFSPIFEKQEDMRNCPFVFEKDKLQQRKPGDYENVKMRSDLIRPRRGQEPALQLNDSS